MVMLELDERGSFNPLVIPFVIVTLLTIGFGVFSVWAFTNYNEQKNNVDAIVATEVAEAEKLQETELRVEFAEEQKNPNKTYISPQSLGSVKIVYPKTWSAYVEEKETGSASLDGFFHPNYVPDVSSDTLFAVRVETSSSSYTRELDSYQKDVEEGVLSAKAITISGAKGTRLDGEIDSDVYGAVVLLPLRDRTLKIWTESTSFMSDYNKVISKLTYSP